MDYEHKHKLKEMSISYLKQCRKYNKRNIGYHKRKILYHFKNKEYYKKSIGYMNHVYGISIETPISQPSIHFHKSTSPKKISSKILTTNLKNLQIKNIKI